MKKSGKKMYYGLLSVGFALAAFVFAVPFQLSAEEPEALEEPIVKYFQEPANTWPKGNYVVIRPGAGKKKSIIHLGPTGLWGTMSGQNVWVMKVDTGSPADGKVLPDDVIYGAYGKPFSAEHDIGYNFAAAITQAETREAGGKLTLNIRRDRTFIEVPIQLKVMGSFSSTTPWNCEKSKSIVAAAEGYMQKGLRPETGLPNNEQYMYGTFHDSVFFLMASGNPECQGLVRRHIRLMMDKLQLYIDGKWRKNWGHPYADKGWGTAYLPYLFAEYYHQTGDATVLPYLDYILNGKPGETNKSNEKNWSWPPSEEPNNYALHPNASMVDCQARILAKEAGLKVNDKKLSFDINYNYHKRAEYGWVKYMGYTKIPFSARQIEKPIEITAEDKKTGMYRAMNGKLGSAAALYSMVDGYDTAVKNCSIRCVYSFNYRGGHGGHWFNSFWTPIGAYFAGPEKFQHFMKGQQWWRELNRDHTGAIWQEGNAKGKEDVLGTGFAIHRVMHLKKLRMFGAPPSCFGPNPPASLKEALAAHRNRDYARAEQLTLEVLATGKVPDFAKAKVNHFLNSVRTLKESIEYDLTFTEKLIKRGNYALAKVELPQLKMVVSPTNPRLKAISSALSSQQAIDHISSAKKKAKAQPVKGKKGDDTKARFNEELRSIVTLVKDSFKHNGPIKHTNYPIYPKDELNQWRVLALPNASDIPPTGWEQPAFDDSKWRMTPLPIKIKRFGFPMAFFRTSFEVGDVNDFNALRVRMVTGRTETVSNVSIYLNGELVARGGNPPDSLAFNLTPESLKLLKTGKNVLAVSAKYGPKCNFSLRLEGVLKNPKRQEITPTGK